jgi:hypothetical protein
MEGANVASFAFHMMIGVKVNGTHARSLKFDISIGKPETTDSDMHNWSMSNWG